MKMVSAALLAASLLAQASALFTRQHPFRCSLPTSKCTGFGNDCSKDADCFSYHCYQKKCGYAKSCSVNGEMCRQYSAHTCCSGKCKPVVMVDDCHRLLKGSGSPAMNGGVNLNRQCQNLGVCEPFAPTPDGPSVLSTPWSVAATDLAVKYSQRGQLTFKEGSIVRTDLFVARKVGQTYDKIQADTMKPGAIRDAGVIVFSDDSKTHAEFGKAYVEGVITYCVAPILRNGAGGGYYAVGINCCGTPEKFEFACGDAMDENVKSALVIGAATEKYATAQSMLEPEHGWKFHDKTKGIMTPLPMFVHILKDYVQEALTPHAGYTYVPQATVTQCVAPIMDGTGTQTSAQYWSAGIDCCDAKTGFKCGDIGTGRSGERQTDSGGFFHAAVTMAELRYNLDVLPPATPTYWSWTSKILVPTPPSA